MSDKPTRPSLAPYSQTPQMPHIKTEVRYQCSEIRRPKSMLKQFQVSQVVRGSTFRLSYRSRCKRTLYSEFLEIHPLHNTQACVLIVARTNRYHCPAKFTRHAASGCPTS